MYHIYIINHSYFCLIIIFFFYFFQTTYNKDSASIKLSSQSQVLGDAMQNFNQNLVEITLEVCAQKLLLRNYVDDTSGKFQ